MSPTRVQHLLATNDADLSAGRDRLHRQIALLRAARSGINQHANPINLSQLDDSLFIAECQQMAAGGPDETRIDDNTPLEQFLAQLGGQDPRQYITLLTYAWLDMATRAVLPHLHVYDPGLTEWLGLELHALSNDETGLRFLTDDCRLSSSVTLSETWQNTRPSGRYGLK